MSLGSDWIHIQQLRHALPKQVTTNQEEEGWYYEEENRTVGPISNGALAEMLKSGKLQPWKIVHHETGPRIAAAKAYLFCDNLTQKSPPSPKRIADDDPDVIEWSQSPPAFRFNSETGTLDPVAPDERRPNSDKEHRSSLRPTSTIADATILGLTCMLVGE